MPFRMLCHWNANPEDFAHLLRDSGPIHPFAGFAGRMVSLVFDPRDSLPRPMQREVASAGWEVAAPEAYPTLLVTNTPAGGVSRRDADDLCAALRAVAALTREAPGALSAGERAECREPRTGVRLVHHAAGDSPFADLSSSLWEAPVELSPAGPEGPRARPGSALELPADHGLVEALAGERGCAIWESGELWGMAEPETLQLRFGGGEWEDSSLESGEGIEEIDHGRSAPGRGDARVARSLLRLAGRGGADRMPVGARGADRTRAVRGSLLRLPRRSLVGGGRRGLVRGGVAGSRPAGIPLRRGSRRKRRVGGGGPLRPRNGPHGGVSSTSSSAAGSCGATRRSVPG